MLHLFLFGLAPSTLRLNILHVLRCHQNHIFIDDELMSDNILLNPAAPNTYQVLAVIPFLLATKILLWFHGFKNVSADNGDLVKLAIAFSAAVALIEDFGYYIIPNEKHLAIAAYVHSHKEALPLYTCACALWRGAA